MPPCCAPVCCLLSVVCCLLSVVCCLLSVVCTTNSYLILFASIAGCSSTTKPVAPSYGPYVPPNNQLNSSDKISGGLAFLIFVLVLSVVYVVGGMAYIRHKTHVWGFPNAERWEALGGLVSDGFKVVTTCGKWQASSGSTGASYNKFPASHAGSSGSAAAAAGDSTRRGNGSEYTDI